MSARFLQALDPAVRLFQAKDFRGALHACQRLLGSRPDDPDVLGLLAEVHGALKNMAEARTCLERISTLRPGDAAVLRRLGACYLDMGEAAQAVKTLEAAIELEPGNARAHNNLGRALHRLGDLPGAQRSLRQALMRDPNSVTAHLNLGLVLSDQREFGSAVPVLERCLTLQPGQPTGWLQLATVLLELDRPAEALTCVERALALNGQSAQAHYVRARALRVLERPREALASCEHALRLNPQLAEAHYGRGLLLRGWGDASGATAAFEAALHVRANYAAADWARAMAVIPALPVDADEMDRSRVRYAEMLGELERRLATAPGDGAVMVGSLQPFYLAYQPRDNCALQVRHGRLCARLMQDWQRARGITRRVSRARAKRRIGFVSAHFKDHSVFWALTRGWLTQLCRDRFELCAFHLGTAEDAQTQFARSQVSAFEHGRRSLDDWARTIVAHEPDVLIYPELGMDDTSWRLGSMRLARTQCVAWGHPQTSGLPTMDYYVSGVGFEPAEAAAHYLEKLVCLPNLGCYYDPEPSQEPGSRRELEGPGPHLICAGVPFKNTTRHDAVWVEIARRLGRGCFHFFKHGDGELSTRVFERVSRAFEASGLEAARYLRLHPWATRGEFEALLRGADLMLDTIGFSGFNTVAQALACALPVVTQRGAYLRGRLGSGILERLGLQELIARDDASYVDMVVRLSECTEAREAVRRDIRKRHDRLLRDASAVKALEEFLGGLP